MKGVLRGEIQRMIIKKVRGWTEEKKREFSRKYEDCQRERRKHE